MKTRISATKAARTFSDLVNRAQYRGETFVVERNGKPACEIVPARPGRKTLADLFDLLESIPRPDDEYFDIVEKAAKSQRPIGKSPWER